MEYNFSIEKDPISLLNDIKKRSNITRRSEG